jgi:hypothetical protein
VAQFSIEIPDGEINRVVDAICAIYGRPDSVDNPSFDDSIPEGELNSRVIPNPETRGKFANRKVREFLTENVHAYETQLAAEAAREGVQVDFTISDPS